MELKILRMVLNFISLYLQLNNFLTPLRFLFLTIKSRTAFLFHANFTPISHGLHRIFLKSYYQRAGCPEGGIYMTLLGLEWYWWLLIAVILVISIPFKIRFMKWWNKRQQEKKSNQHGKWGDDE